MYADYIFPDLSYLERWEFQGSHPCVPNKVQPVRQPAMAPIPEDCTVYGQRMPMSFEAMILGIAEKLKLPGFGEDAFGKGLDLKHPMTSTFVRSPTSPLGKSPTVPRRCRTRTEDGNEDLPRSSPVSSSRCL